MSLYKRGNSEVWWVGFTVDGVRVQRSSGTADRKKAQEFHDRLKAEMWNQAKLGARPDPTWNDISMRWLKERETWSNYRQYVTRIRGLHQYLGGKRLSDITPDLIDKIKLALKSEVIDKKGKKTRTPGTVNQYLSLISGVFHYALERELIDRIPKIRKLPTPSRRIRWITPQEVEAICHYLPEYAVDMVWFSLATGLRKTNVVRLRWDQIDMQRKIIWYAPEEVKNREALMVPLNQDALAIIRKRIGTHDTYVFTRDGEVMADVPRKSFEKARKLAGIKDFRWHDLRHTWASWHINAGTNPLELQELGGWKNAAMLRRYAHFAKDKLHEAAGRIVTPATTLQIVSKQNQ